jgi:hypothetical protein
MSRLENYIRAVAAWLPRAGRKEEVEEIAGNLWSKLESEEGPQDEDSHKPHPKSFFKKLPHPLVAAHDYWPRQNWIDPLLLPVAVRFLRIAFFGYFLPEVAVMVICVVVAAALGVPEPENAFVQNLRVLLVPALLIIGILALANVLLSIFRKDRSVSPRL